MPVDTDRRHHHPTYEASDFDVNDNSANNILLNMEYLKDKIVIADDATLSVNGESSSSSSSSSSSGSSDAYRWDTHHDNNENDDDEDSFSNSSDNSYSSAEDQVSSKKKSSMYASSYDDKNQKKKVSIYSTKCPVPKNKTVNRDSSYKTSLKKERSKSLYSNTTATSRTTATSNSSDQLTGRFVEDDSEGSLEKGYREREDRDSVSEQHQHRFHRQASTTIPEELEEDNDDGDASDKASFTPITPIDSDDEFADDDPPPPPPSDDDDGISDISDDESSLLMVRHDGRSDGEGNPKKKKTNISKVIKAVSSKVSPRSRSRKKGIKNINPRNSPRSSSNNGRPNSPMGDTLKKALNVFASADSQIASWKSPKTNSKKSNSNSEMLDDSDDLLARTDDILGDLYQKKKQYLPSESSSDSEAEEEKQHDEFLDRIANAHANALGKAERAKAKSLKRLAKRQKKKKKAQQRGSNNSIYSDQSHRKAINSIDGDDSSPRRPRRRSIKVAISRPLKMLKNMSRSQRNLIQGSQRSLQTDNGDGVRKRCSQTSVVTIQTNNSNNNINDNNKNYDPTQRGSFAAALSRASSAGIDESHTKSDELKMQRQKSVDAQIFDAITTAVSDLKETSNSRKTAFHAPRKLEGNVEESDSKSGMWHSVLRSPNSRSTDILKVYPPPKTVNQRQESGETNGHIRQSIGYHTAEDEVDLDDTKNRIKEAASRFKTRQKTMRNQQLKRELRISKEEEQKLEMEIKQYERRIDILEEGHKSITSAAMSVPLHDLFVLQETTLIQLDAVDDTRNTLKIQARLYRSQLASNNEYLESLRDERVDEASKSDQLELLFTKCGLAPAGFDDLMSSQIKLQLECQELNQKLDALGGYYDYPEEKHNSNSYNNHGDADTVAMPTFNRGVSLQISDSGFSGGSSQNIQEMMMNIAGNNNKNDSNYLFPGDAAANKGKNYVPRRRSKTVAYMP